MWAVVLRGKMAGLELLCCQCVVVVIRSAVLWWS